MVEETLAQNNDALLDYIIPGFQKMFYTETAFLDRLKRTARMSTGEIFFSSTNCMAMQRQDMPLKGAHFRLPEREDGTRVHRPYGGFMLRLN
jgi:hypothetical protein